MNGKIFQCAVALLGLAGVVLGASGPAFGDRIDAIVAPYVEAGDFMGVVAVQRDGAEAWVRAYGLASVELDVAHRPNDIFMIGSVSKQFTAVAVLLLEEAGMLSTSDAVGKYLPDLRHGATVTLEQLLTHTSGVVDIYSLDRFGLTGGRSGTFAEILADLGAAPLDFAPGTRYSYSNGGYALLAAVVERVSGLDYGEYVRQRLFEPLGMSSTAHDRPGAAVRGRVAGYEPWGRAGMSPVLPVAAGFTTGSGSIWSSARDLLVWNAALHGGRVLSEGSYGKLVRDHGNGYGFGISVFQRFGRPVIGHDGRVAGYASDVARYLDEDEDATIVVLSNVESVARDQIRRLVAAAVFGEPYSSPEPRRSFDGPAGPLEELAGVYSFGPGFEVSVRVSEGRLLARANQGGSSELIPGAAGEWFSRMLYATVRFGRDEEGAVDRLIWGSGEGSPVGSRVR